MASRRLVLLLMLLGLTGQAIPSAFAKDGDGGGDSDGGGHSGDDNDNDSDDDDDRDEDSGDDSGRGSKKNDDRRIRNAVRSGKARPLRDILSSVRERYKGDVVRIRLTGSGDKLVYRIRLIDKGDNLIEVRVNASTGRIINALGVR